MQKQIALWTFKTKNKTILVVDCGQGLTADGHTVRLLDFFPSHGERYSPVTASMEKAQKNSHFNLYSYFNKITMSDVKN